MKMSMKLIIATLQVDCRPDYRGAGLYFVSLSLFVGDCGKIDGLEENALDRICCSGGRGGGDACGALETVGTLGFGMSK